MAKDKEGEREDESRQIVPTIEGTAKEILDWLYNLFHITTKDTKPGEPKREPDTFPERVEVCPVFGPGGRDKGEPLDFETWKPTSSKQPGTEQLVALAHRFFGAAKRHASSRNHKRYAIYAYNPVRGSFPYMSLSFIAAPGPREYKAGEEPATDDDDTHRDRMLQTSLEHNRWMFEQNNVTMAGIIQLLMEDKREMSRQQREMNIEHQQLIKLYWDSMSRKEEIDDRRRFSEMRNRVLEDLWKSVKGWVPPLITHFTKGKVGVKEGVQQVLDSLTPEQTIKMFGKWDGGNCIEKGVLDKGQIEIICGIAEGSVVPERIKDFMMGLQPDQMAAAQEVLTLDQVQTLMGLAKAVTDSEQQKEASA